MDGFPWKSLPTPCPQKVLFTEKGGLYEWATRVITVPTSLYNAPGLTVISTFVRCVNPLKLLV